MARKVLIVAYYFPPLGGAGVQRTLKFIKYLPEFGWQPVVLTAKVKGLYLSDSSLENEIAANVSIHRTPALLFPSWLPWRLRKFVARWLLVVDEQLGWLPYAIAQGRKIIKHSDIDAIYTTSAPYTTHLIGLRLKRQSGLPWVADFRDPWVGNFSNTFPSPLHKQIAQRLEYRVSQAAERVIVVSEPMRQALLARHFLAPERVYTLPNGYDRCDFEDVQALGQRDDQLVMVYTGSFYGPQTPIYLLQGLRVVLDAGRVSRHKVQLRLIGNIGQATRKQIEALGLVDTVQVTGYLPHRQSIGHLLGADLLVLVVGSGPGSEAVLTGKIFEYLAAGKPVLALTPPGVAADLIREAQAGVVVDPEDVTAIASQITAIYEAWQRCELKITGDQNVIARYDRRLLTGQLARVLDEVAK